MLDYAGIDREIVLFGWGNKIELWSPENYNKMLNSEPADFAKLAEEVMGNINLNGGGAERGLS